MNNLSVLCHSFKGSGLLVNDNHQLIEITQTFIHSQINVPTCVHVLESSGYTFFLISSKRKMMTKLKTRPFKLMNRSTLFFVS